jgi:glycosyltransferase involved in cell wall biosynthesis
VKFSVLIPTRNRLEYLKQALYSVQQQNYPNWEAIISDNFSDDDVFGFIRDLKDDRIKYFRTKSFIPVTDNWNYALEKSTGDYVIMLGDDDCLLQDYFKICKFFIEKYSSPDLMYTSALNYVYPKVLHGSPDGYLITWPNASFLSPEKKPYILDRQEAIALAKQALNFRIMFNFNAQFSIIKRTLINELKKYGPFYQSPYPDYYSTTAMFLKADRILAVSCPIVVVGMSPKSFGCYYFNNREKEGIEMLNNLALSSLLPKTKKQLMPGSHMNSSWLLSMESVFRNFGSELPLKLNYKKYRFLQVLYFLKKYACRENVTLNDLWNMVKALLWWEKFAYLPLLMMSAFIHLFPKPFLQNWACKMLYKFSHPSHGIGKVLNTSYNDMTDVFRGTNCYELKDYQNTFS